MPDDDFPFKACLIGGTGRSGTTILKEIFSKHPSVANVPEGRFTIDPDGLVDFYNTFCEGWSPYLFDLRLKRLNKMLYALGKHRFFFRAYTYMMQKVKMEKTIPMHLVPRYAGIGIERQCPKFLKFAKELIEDLSEYSYSGQWNGSTLFEPTKMYFAPPFDSQKLAGIFGKFWRKVIKETCITQNAKFYVEDNTWNILWFDKLLTFLPETKLVHVIRDPRDVVASYTQMRWAPDDTLQAARWHKYLINRWLKVKDNVRKESYMEIRLEKLVAQPRQTLQDICSFWEIPWDDSLLSTDLSKSHSGRWKRDFTSNEIKDITSELEDEMGILGYS